MSEMTEPPAIGIDLGGTFAKAAYLDQNGSPKVIYPRINDSFSAMTPSAVWLLDGETIVGEPALMQWASRDDEYVAYCFKQRMTDTEPFFHGYSGVQLSSEILKSLKRDAEAQLDTEVNRAVIACPPWYTTQERDCVMHACELAGLADSPQLILEPVAAAMAADTDDPSTDLDILVLDVGGTAFSVSLVRKTGSHFELVAFEYSQNISGMEVSERLAFWAMNQAFQQGHFFPRRFEDPMMIARIQAGMAGLRFSPPPADALPDRYTFRTHVLPPAQGAMRHLAVNYQAELFFGTLKEEPRPAHYSSSWRFPGVRDALFSVEVSRVEVTELMEDLLCEMRWLSRRVMDKAGTNAPTRILAVGAAWRMPGLYGQAAAEFGIEPECPMNPALCVVHGAAIATRNVRELCRDRLQNISRSALALRAAAGVESRS